MNFFKPNRSHLEPPLDPRKPSAPAPSTPPAETDPVFRRLQWRMLLATMFCYLFYYTGRQTFGFAIPGIEKELGLSKTELGWCSTGLLWAYALGQVINGNLGDKFGGRRMMSLGAILSCGLNWLTSFSMGLTSLRIGWAANGFVQSMGWAPGGRVISNWWSHHERGKVFGLYTFAAGMASVLSFGTSLLMLQVFMLDWRWIFRLPVLLLFVAGVIYYFVARDRPQDLGFGPIDDDGDSTGDAESLPQEDSRTRYLAVLSNWRFMIASVSVGFQNLARYGLLVWVPVYFLGEGWKKENGIGGPWIAMALPAGMALGAMASGWMSDRLFNSRRWPVISGFMFAAAIATGVMYLTPKGATIAGIPSSLPLLFLSGFFVYGPQSAFWALCPDMLGKERSGTATGVMNCTAYIFAGLGEPFIGWMIETNEGHSALGGDSTALVFPIVAVACLLGGILAPLIRR